MHYQQPSVNVPPGHPSRDRVIFLLGVFSTIRNKLDNFEDGPVECSVVWTHGKHTWLAYVGVEDYSVRLCMTHYDGDELDEDYEGTSLDRLMDYFAQISQPPNHFLAQYRRPNIVTDN